jgi:hypothetical protein
LAMTNLSHSLHEVEAGSLSRHHDASPLGDESASG